MAIFDEARFIRLVEARFGTAPLPGAPLTIGDDCALIAPGPGLTAVTTDTMVEGVHFKRAWATAKQIGQRLAAVNLSDLAGMGAEPTFALLSVSLTHDVTEGWAKGFLDGFATELESHGCRVVGGNMTAAPAALSFTVTLMGRLPKRGGLLRSGAKVGDLVCVTGTLGDGALGYLDLTAGRKSALAGRYLSPTPRVEWGQLLLRERLATACMDISDGLALDLERMLAASGGHSARIDLGKIPLSPAARRREPTDDFWRTVVAGGDDYELLFTVNPRKEARLSRLVSEGVLTASIIGRVESPRSGAPVRVIRPDGTPFSLSSAGWLHGGSPVNRR
ncbi:MAG: thiamine-phosphate kinase [Nitrospinae bacterium]|nr:thiamine-phosphate kinase [Nitrospinota bacterium]